MALDLQHGCMLKTELKQSMASATIHRITPAMDKQQPSQQRSPQQQQQQQRRQQQTTAAAKARIANLKTITTVHPNLADEGNSSTGATIRETTSLLPLLIAKQTINHQQSTNDKQTNKQPSAITHQHYHQHHWRQTAVTTTVRMFIDSNNN